MQPSQGELREYKGAINVASPIPTVVPVRIDLTPLPGMTLDCRDIRFSDPHNKSRTVEMFGTIWYIFFFSSFLGFLCEKKKRYPRNVCVFFA
jgi:hypothetical protein